MDFIGGALPNVMFLIGVIAIGIGLGLEFKLIEVKNTLSRGGRIGAGVVGLVLVALSIALYLHPLQTTSSTAQAVVTQQSAASPIPQELAPSTSATEQHGSSQPLAVAPGNTPAASPALAPTATLVPTVVPTVAVPDIRGMSPKDAAKALAQVGLQLGEPQASCSELGVDASLVLAVRKDRIACQSHTPESNAPIGTIISYALSDSKKD